MPIVQVRGQQNEQYLSVPSSLTDPDPILAEWYKDAWQSEMFVYPPDYAGDITPEKWDTHSFMLHVDATGEQAQMMASAKLQTKQEMAEAIEHLRAATPEQARSAQSIGSVAIVNERNRSVFVATILERSALAIGGVVLHVRPSKLRNLKAMFPTTEIENPTT